jgi:hypothetical protein
MDQTVHLNGMGIIPILVNALFVGGQGSSLFIPHAMCVGLYYEEGMSSRWVCVRIVLMDGRNKCSYCQSEECCYDGYTNCGTPCQHPDYNWWRKLKAWLARLWETI